MRILHEVDGIAAEDTRQTRKLLTHYDIHTRLVSYHEHNKATSGPELVRRMAEGYSIALVSDAGMPAISDPGADLVRSAIAAGIPVVPIPGASASLAALVVSGLPTERFTFVGFLPRDKKAMERQLASLSASAGTVVLYESPHRIRRTLETIERVWGDAPTAVVRELTKRFEEIARGRLRELIDWVEQEKPQGEFCIIVDRSSVGDNLGESEEWWNGLSLEEHVGRYEAEGAARKEAMKQTAVDRRISRRDVYNALQKNIPGSD